MDLWAYQRGVVLDFSRPGKPTDNAYIEAFNGRFRAECLNAHWFMSLADAQAAVEKGKLRATYEKRWNDSNTVPDDLTDDDIPKLKKTAQAWQDSLDALGSVTQSAATGTGPATPFVP